MKKSLLMLLSMVLVASTALAGQIPSASGSAAIGKLTVVQQAATQDWTPVVTTIIQVPQQKELVFDVALQCELYTDTLVRSKAGDRDTSTAEAAIDVRVKLQKYYQDGSLSEPFFAQPGAVTYAKRTQTLMAKFQGIFQTCLKYVTVIDPYTGKEVQECVDYGANTCLDVTAVDENQDGVIDDYVVTVDETCLDYEEVQLILNTINANAFNYVAADLEQGEYRVTVEAAIKTSTTSTNGGAIAKGIVGLGSMVVDEVRFIKSDTGTGM